MIELLEMASEKVVGIKIDGKIEKSDIEKVFEAIDQKLSGDARLRIYVEVAKLGGMSLDALITDLKLGLPKFKHFDRKAIVSDQTWLKPFVAMGDKLFPSIDVKHFAPEERDEAVAWVQEG